MVTTVENLIDPTSNLVTLRKKPDESRLFDIDATKYMRTSDTIATLSSLTATAVGNVSGAAAVTVSLPTHDGAQTIQGKFAAGTDLEDYLIVAKFITTAGDTLEVHCMLWVRSTFG
jgi:hypothetical protein